MTSFVWLRRRIRNPTLTLRLTLGRSWRPVGSRTMLKRPRSRRTGRSLSLRLPTEASPNRADRQALDFYRSFDGMNPRQATDERLWAWMTHFRLHAYGLERWRRLANVNMKNYVRAHWFSSGSADAFWRHNTASRTWWMAHTALKAAQGAAGSFSAADALRAFADTASFYHIPMYYNFTRDPMILGEVVRAILNEAEGINAEKGTYALLRRLNLMGGTQLLPLLPREQFRERIVDDVERIMSDPELGQRPLQNSQPDAVQVAQPGRRRAVDRARVDGRTRGIRTVETGRRHFCGHRDGSLPAYMNTWTGSASSLSFEVVRVKAGNIKDNILAGTSP